jgi:hypothetical protein
MFIQRTRIVPATGKLPEAEMLLVERVKAAQGRGQRVGLARRIFSSDGAALSVTLVADDLAGIEQVRQANLADPSFQAMVAKLAPLLHEAASVRVLESLLTAPRTGTTITLLVSVAPAPGAEVQVASQLEEFVRAGQAAGVTTSLWRRVFSSDGPMLAVIFRYADLAELDRVRKERAAATRDLAAAIGGHLRAPVQQRLFEVVVPLPN